MALTLEDTSWKFTDHREWRDHFRGWPPVIVTCAITGGLQGKEANPNLPESPEEQAESTYGAYKAGASIVHIHARDPDTNYVTGAPKGEHFYRANKLIRERCPDIIINDTCGTVMAMEKEEDFHQYYTDCKPELSTFDVGGLMMRGRRKKREDVKGRVVDKVLGARGGIGVAAEEETEFEMFIPLGWSFCGKLARALKAHNIKPEFELFSTQSWWFVDYVLYELKLADPPYWCQLVFGQEGACSPPDPMSAMEMIGNMPPNSLFSTIGIGPLQLPIITLGLILGGHIRVGFEDNVYFSRGVKAESNAQFVERAVRIVHELNREVATPAQAREMLNISQTPTQYP